MATCPSCQAEVAQGAKFCTFCGGIVPKTQDTSDDPLIGRTFARNFRIEKLLGVGGMGKVYKAIQISLDKPVVLKLLHPQFAGDDTLVHRFHREARAASKLNHPNSISIIDFGQDDDGTLFMAMEYLAGRDLFALLQAEDPIPEARIARIVMQICSALAEAHEQGVIHRDLKPENIMVEDRRDTKDFVKVLDFGIAKIQDPGGKETRALTAQGMVCGTPEYMAPEQARGEDLDARTDVYALGVMMYQLVTGQLPFQADNAIGIVTKHIVEQPKPPRQMAPERTISEAIEGIILKCLQKKVEQRYQSVLELEQALAPLASQGGATSPGQALGVATAPATTQPPSAAVSPTAAPAPVAAGVSEPAVLVAPARKSSTIIIAAAAVGVAIIAGAAFVALARNKTDVGTTGSPDASGAVVAAQADAGSAGASGNDAALALADPGDDEGGGSSAPKPGPAQGNSKGSADKPKPEHHAADIDQQIDRSHVMSLIKKGDSRSGAGDHKTALKHYLKARKLDPSNAEVRRKIGMEYYNLGDTPKACASLKKFLKLDPSAPAGYRSFVKGLCQ